LGRALPDTKPKPDSGESGQAVEQVEGYDPPKPDLFKEFLKKSAGQDPKKN